jgi:late competence protein required for DNA uptake (superfamily II DNA/RNA helicase)
MPANEPREPLAELEALRRGVLEIVVRCGRCEDGKVRVTGRYDTAITLCRHCSALRKMLTKLGILAHYGQHVEPEEAPDATP